MSGTLYGVGVGPGDPELITLKALRVLERTSIIAWPAPPEGDSLARRIAAPHLNGDKTEIAIRMPIEAGRFPDQRVYDTAADEIATHLAAGRDVAVLCEGDPFFYGSFMYLFGRLAQDHTVQVVPGISSLTASAAALGAPLAARNDTLAILPATLPDAELEARLRSIDAAVFIKVGRHLGRLRRLLKRLGLAADAHYIEHATMADQRTQLLREVPDERAPYFSMVLVHRRGEAWT